MNVGHTMCAKRWVGRREALQALVFVLITWSVLSVAAIGQLRAGGIDGISPAKARTGEIVTIQGHGFGALNVRVTVGGVPAAVLQATGSTVTFRVPDGVKPGLTQVVATNPGFQSGSIAFRILEGILLPGNPAAPAISALSNVSPVRAPAEDLLNHLFLTRIDLRIEPGATVGQLNAALLKIDGGIVSMNANDPILTIAIPRADPSDLKLIVAELNDQPGIEWAEEAFEAATQSLPQPISAFVDQELFATRFPAAWNALTFVASDGSLATRDCTNRKVPVLVGDIFAQPAPSGFEDFASQVPNLHHAPANESGTEPHGYEVTAVLAAMFDDKTPTGANPFPQCLDITGVQVGGLTMYQTTTRLLANFPASSPFVLNFSIGFNRPDPDCDPTTATNGQPSCTPDSASPPPDAENSVSLIVPAITRARTAAYWKLSSQPHWNEFLVAASAGNAANRRVATVYPGLTDASYNSSMTVAARADSMFLFIQNPKLWAPANLDPSLPDLTAQPPDVARFQAELTQDGLDKVGPETNVLVAGSTQTGTTFADLKPSGFSQNGADVVAVGEVIFTYPLSGLPVQGTSFTAPQVSGLASYLWLLSDDLRHNPNVTALTQQAIIDNARSGLAGNVIDAYATILSLDAAGTPAPLLAPVRLAILDVNGDGVFDETDVQEFLEHYLDSNGNPIADPATRDYSRFDLNGDGFTGGGSTEQFDLDRVGSAQYGAASYSSDVTQEIEGQTVHFNEKQPTDLQILCYYAYSPLYTGDTTVRATLLRRCAGTTVKVMPASASVATGATQQFSAQVIGPQDPRVTWSVDGTAGGNSGSGTITDAGLYTAPTSPGTHTVRATSVADPTAFGEATVTATSGSIARVFLNTGQDNGSGPLLFQAFISFVDSKGLPINSTFFEWPINDVAGFMAKVNTLVAGVSRFTAYSINIGNAPAPVSLTVSLSVPVGNLFIGGSGCGSNFTVSAADVDNLDIVPQCNSTAAVNVHDVNLDAELAPDHSTVTLNAHNIGLGQGNFGALFIGCAFSGGCFTVQSSTVNVQATAIAQVSVTASNSSIKVSGQIQPWNVPSQCGINGSDAGCIPGIWLQGNSNTELSAQLSGNVSFFLLDNNSWSAPPQISIGDEVIARDARTTNLGLVSITNNRGLVLGGISGLGQITGDLRITSNIGFNDDAANAFANARSVQGSVTIGGNRQ